MLQINKHVAPGALRTVVLDGSSSNSNTPPLHDLAWQYDVVITTFQRLSNEWVVSTSKRRRDIPLLQVRGGATHCQISHCQAS